MNNNIITDLQATLTKNCALTPEAINKLNAGLNDLRENSQAMSASESNAEYGSTFQESFPDYLKEDVLPTTDNKAGAFELVHKLFEANSPTLDFILKENGLTSAMSLIQSFSDNVSFDFQAKMNSFKIEMLQLQIETTNIKNLDAIFTLQKWEESITKGAGILEDFIKILQINQNNLNIVVYTASFASGIFLYRKMLLTHMESLFPKANIQKMNFSAADLKKHLILRNAKLTSYHKKAIPIIAFYSIFMAVYGKNLNLNIGIDILNSASIMFMMKNKDNKKSKQNITNNSSSPLGNGNNNFLFLLIFLFTLFINSSLLKNISPTAYEFFNYIQNDGIGWLSYTLILWLTCTVIFELFEVILFILLTLNLYSVPSVRWIFLPKFIFKKLKELEDNSKLEMKNQFLLIYFRSFLLGVVLLLATILLCYLLGTL